MLLSIETRKGIPLEWTEEHQQRSDEAYTRLSTAVDNDQLCATLSNLIELHQKSAQSLDAMLQNRKETLLIEHVPAELRMPL